MKLLGLACSIVLFCSGVQARADVGGGSATGMNGVELNPVIGVSIFTFADSPGSVSNSTGFTIGALAPIGSGNVRFEPGLLFAQEGATGPGATVTSNYLLIPMAAKFVALQNNGLDLHLRAGVAPSVLLSGKAKNGDVSKDVTSSIQSFDLQGMIGVGGTIATTHGFAVTLDATYLRGFLNLAKEGKALHNTGVLLALGALF